MASSSDQSVQSETVSRRCTGCGSLVDLPADLVASTCSYCGSSLVDTDRAAAAVDKVAPFRMERSVARARLSGYLSGKLFAPDAVRKLRVDERGLRGVLVPFWSYDGVVRSRYSADVGITYLETRTYTDSEGKRRTKTVPKTEWFPLSGTVARRFHDHLVSASKGLPEKESNALEPFDLGWARDFDPRMISGFEAELPSVESDAADETARQELETAERHRIARDFLPGDRNKVRDLHSEVTVEDREIVLLPVWTSCFVHNGNPYRILVNGQTGKAAGKVPLSIPKILLAVGLALALITGIVILYQVTR